MLERPEGAREGDVAYTRDRERRRETGQEKINRPANMCQENGEKDGGVERTHREARSHDLMNELAWLLASVVGYALTLPRRRLSSFARRLSAAKETRAMPTTREQAKRLNFERCNV